MATYRIAITVEADYPDNDSLKDAIRSGTFDMNQAITDAGPDMPLQIGMQLAPLV